jgi:hypothetical protein
VETMELLCARQMSLLNAEGGMINMQNALMLIPNGPPKERTRRRLTLWFSSLGRDRTAA